MNERWSSLGRQMQADWDASRAERVKGRVLTRHRNGRRVRVVALGAVALAAAAAVLLTVFLRTEAPVVSVTPRDDGTEVISLTAQTSFRAESSATERVYRLLAGRARFEVEHQDRPFRVVAGLVEVEVVGTIFEVERLEGGRAEVLVRRGRVRVRYPGGEQFLNAREQGTFPPEIATVPATDTEAEPAPVVEPPLPQSTERPRSRPTPPLPPTTPNDLTPSDLMVAADQAREEGRPADAAALLQQVLDEHPRDSRAALAAFTLGRVLLEELNRPGDAAEAFARARALSGPLAEDALAREVDARSRAGEHERAAELAREYLMRYPDGRRAREVREHGGIQD